MPCPAAEGDPEPAIVWWSYSAITAPVRPFAAQFEDESESGTASEPDASSSPVTAALPPARESGTRAARAAAPPDKAPRAAKVGPVWHALLARSRTSCRLQRSLSWCMLSLGAAGGSL